MGGGDRNAFLDAMKAVNIPQASKNNAKLIVRIYKKLDPRLLVLVAFIIYLLPEKSRDIVFIPSISTGVQRQWVS